MEIELKIGTGQDYPVRLSIAYFMRNAHALVCF